ncbi:MAG: exosortase [Verrucomicrobia bacterium]|nr:MAG: exosortase [Verrucomicrobiota bacterium]PYK01288.1 MAG: exosortase [Verrucomicrobiota bacterium]
MAETSSTPGRPARFLVEAAEFWRAMPDKPLFFSLFAVWVIFFHFLGNSTFGYTDTPSLFGWLNYDYHNSADDQHGFLVPLVVVVLLFVKREELIQVPKTQWWPALALVVAGLLLHVVGYVVQQTRVSIVAFFVGLYGLAGLVWGPRWLKATFFPYFLFLFCVPIATLSETITVPLRMLATRVTVSLVQTVLGIGVVQDGTSIWEPTGRYQYEVAAACSGLRSLTAIFALATIYGFTEFRRNWQRLTIMTCAFPLAVIGNVVRLTTIIVAAETFGQSAGNYVHENFWFGLLPYVPPMVGLMTLGHWLGRRRVRPIAVLEAKPV